MDTNNIFKMEIRREIRNNEDATCYEIGPDTDGLNCVEIRYRGEDGIVKERMTFPIELARLIADALFSCADELKGIKKY